MLGELIPDAKVVPKQPKYIKMLVLVRPETREFLRQKAEQADTTMSKIIRKALAEYFVGEDL